MTQAAPQPMSERQGCREASEPEPSFCPLRGTQSRPSLFSNKILMSQKPANGGDISALKAPSREFKALSGA